MCRYGIFLCSADERSWMSAGSLIAGVTLSQPFGPRPDCTTLERRGRGSSAVRRLHPLRQQGGRTGFKRNAALAFPNVPQKRMRHGSIHCDQVVRSIWKPVNFTDGPRTYGLYGLQSFWFLLESLFCES